MKFKVIISVLLLFLSCSTVNQIVNPFENPLLSWLFDKSCISVDVPPITLTSEKTAIEKQILGEKTELMPDGWLIISSNYVVPYKEEDIANDPNIKEEFQTLYLYKNMAEFYLLRNYLGSDEKGNLLLLPKRFRKWEDLRHIRIAKEVADILNQAKNQIYQYLQKKDRKIAQQFIKHYKNFYRNLGWNYDQKKGWYQ